MNKLLLCGLLLASALSYAADQKPTKPITFVAQIESISVGRGVMDFIDNDVKLVAAEKITFRTELPCGDDTLPVNAKSLGMKDKDYIDHLKYIATNATNGEYFYIIAGSCEAKTTSFITKIQLCTQATCGKEYVTNKNIIWLDEAFEKTVKRDAYYFIEKPFPFDKKTKLWKVTGWYISEDQDSQKQNTSSVNKGKKVKAFEGYTNSKDFISQQYVSSFTAYYPTGAIKMQTNFNAEGKRDGELNYFYANGQPNQTGTYNNGLLEGLVTTYHENGNIESKTQFHQGKHADGQCNHYGPDGQLVREHAYLNNQLDGKYVDYFPDGKIEKESVYVEGSPIGELKEYDKSGQLIRFFRYDQKGNLEGKQQIYSKQGVLISEDNFNNGFQLSRKAWYENGNLREQKQWKKNANGDSDKYGDFKQWYENGQLQSEQSYSNDELVISKEWFKNGNKKYSFQYQDGTFDGVQKTWNEKTGTLVTEEHYDKGKLQGSSKYWEREAGKLVTQKFYQQGQLNGPFKEYDATTGKLINEGAYLDGELDGERKIWDAETGHLVNESLFKRGRIEGVWKGYDKDTGELTLELSYADGTPVDGLQTEKRYKNGKITSYGCYVKGASRSTLNEPDETERLAKNGDIEAQVQLGRFYFQCQHYDESRKAFEHPILQLNPEALYIQARMYAQGEGEVEDRQKSIELMFKAAEGGYVLAQREVGLLYIPADGRLLAKGTPTEIKTSATLAHKWLLAAAAQQDPQALYVLGLMSEMGVGVKKSQSKAQDYYDQAIKLGSMAAYQRSEEIKRLAAEVKGN